MAGPVTEHILRLRTDATEMVRGLALVDKELASVAKQADRATAALGGGVARSGGGGGGGGGAGSRARGLAGGMSAAAAASKKLKTANNQMRTSMQNMGYQLQDTVVQLEMGTHWTRVLGQQGPQMVLGLGPVVQIMVALGAAALAVASKFVNFGDSLEGATKWADELTKSLDALKGSIADSSNLGKLTEQFGKFSTNIQTLRQEVNNLEADLLQSKLFSGNSDIASGVISDLEGDIDAASQRLSLITAGGTVDAAGEAKKTAELKKQKAILDDLVANWQLATDAQEAFLNAGGNQDAQDRLEATEKLLIVLRDQALVDGKITEQETERLNLLLQIYETQAALLAEQEALNKAQGDAISADREKAEQQARYLAGVEQERLAREKLNAAEASANRQREIAYDYVTMLTEKAADGAREAHEHAQNLAEVMSIMDASGAIPSIEDIIRLLGVAEEAAVRLWNAMSNARIQAAAAGTAGMTSPDAVKSALSNAGVDSSWVAPPGTYRAPVKTGGGGGGGGGGKSEAEKEAERLAEAIKKATEANEELVASFANGTETISFAFGELAVGAVDSFVDTLFSAEKNFGDFAKALLIDMGKIITKQILMAALFKALGLPTGELTGFAGGALGAMGFQGIPQAAKGAVIGGPSLVTTPRGMIEAGEAGPEAIVPLSRGADGGLGVAASPVYVNVENNSTAAVSVTRDEDIIRIAVNESRTAVQGDFSRSMQSGQGAYARGIEQGYTTRRRAT